MENLKNATLEELIMTDDVGEITAKVFTNFLNKNKHKIC